MASHFYSSKPYYFCKNPWSYCLRFCSDGELVSLQVVKKHGDLALSEYARVGRAISLYEVGDKEDAFIEMEDVSVSLKGYPGKH